MGEQAELIRSRYAGGIDEPPPRRLAVNRSRAERSLPWGAAVAAVNAVFCLAAPPDGADAICGRARCPRDW